MSGHHPFNNLRAQMSADRRARNDAAAEAMNRDYVLSQIRREIGLTQADMAARLDVSQPTYSACEKSDNMRIGTLRRIVEAMGGVLSFHVEIGGKDYSLNAHGSSVFV